MSIAATWLGRLGRVSLLLSLWLAVLPTAPLASAAPLSVNAFQGSVLTEQSSAEDAAEAAGESEQAGDGSKGDPAIVFSPAGLSPGLRSVRSRILPPARAPPASGSASSFQARAPPRF